MNFKTGGGTKSGPPEEFSIFDLGRAERRSGAAGQARALLSEWPKKLYSCGNCKIRRGTKRGPHPKIFCQDFYGCGRRRGTSDGLAGNGNAPWSRWHQAPPVQPQSPSSLRSFDAARRDGPQRRSAVGRTFRLFDRSDHMAKSLAEWVGQLRGYPEL